MSDSTTKIPPPVGNGDRGAAHSDRGSSVGNTPTLPVSSSSSSDQSASIPTAAKNETTDGLDQVPSTSGTSREKPEKVKTSTKKKSKEAGGKEKKQTKPKSAEIEGLPKKAKNAYTYFFINEVKGKTGDGQPGFKICANLWNAADPEKKKKYEEMAEKDRQRYREEMKEFEAKHGKVVKPPKQEPSKKKQKEEKKKKKRKFKFSEETPELPKPKLAKFSKPTVSKTSIPMVTAKTQNGETKQIPVFTPEFLEHNKDMESQLRTVRKAVNSLEEESASLEHQVEQYTKAAEKLEADTKVKTAEYEAANAYVLAVKQKILKDLSSMELPSFQGKKPIKPGDNVMEYCRRLQEIFANGNCPVGFSMYRELMLHMDWPL